MGQLQATHNLITDISLHDDLVLALRVLGHA